MGKSKRFSFRVNKSTMKLKLRLFGFHFFGIISKTPNVDTMGLSNLCTDGRLVTFIDYDNVFEYRVLNEVRRLQRKWKIGTVAVLTTGYDIDMQGKKYGSWHVFGIAKLRFHELLDMLEHSSCDPNFKRIPQIFNGRYWTLRAYPKYLDGRVIKGMPVLQRVLYSKTDKELSRSHYDFLVNVYGMPKLPRKYISRFDRSRTLKTIYYQTTQNGWIRLPKSNSLKNLFSKFKK